MKAALVILAFAAAVLFALCGALTIDLHVNELYASLTSAFAGLLLERLP